MIKAYDIAVKKLIQIFANKIPVVGLQNEDGSDGAESVMAQVANKTEKDKIPFPIISIFRSPEINITDGSVTKRAGTAEGYSWVNKETGELVSLVAMRATLAYTIDIFDVTRASAEEVALKLYFRLRNNPEVNATFKFKDFDHTEECYAEIQMNPEVTNVRVNDKGKTQMYKIRFSFNLVNANIFDILVRDLPRLLDYEVIVKFKGEKPRRKPKRPDEREKNIRIETKPKKSTRKRKQDIQ